MIYGLWINAAGVTTASHQTDVIANNLANTETTGFKRQLATTMERDNESKLWKGRPMSDPRFDRMTGGILMAPSAFDLSQGTPEVTHEPLDVLINGDGFLAVQDADGKKYLTRNGSLTLDPLGRLCLNTEGHPQVLDREGKGVELAGIASEQLSVTGSGAILVQGNEVASVGTFSVADQSQLRPVGGTLFQVPENAELEQVSANIVAGSIELSNVDPARELVRLMEVQRQLEANANLIRMQDQTLGTLVNSVGKIS